MRSHNARPGDICRLATDDIVLVTSAAGAYTTVVPVFLTDTPMVGRYINFRGVKCALDYQAKVDNFLVVEKVGFIVPSRIYPKIGDAPPSKFRKVAERMQMLSYVTSEEDVDLVLKSQERSR